MAPARFTIGNWRFKAERKKVCERTWRRGALGPGMKLEGIFIWHCSPEVCDLKDMGEAWDGSLPKTARHYRLRASSRRCCVRNRGIRSLQRGPNYCRRCWYTNCRLAGSK